LRRALLAVSAVLALGTLSGVSASATPAPPPPPAASTVGYIGCSQSVGAVTGYLTVGGHRFWGPEAAYGGGTVQAWADAIPAPGATRFNGRWGAFIKHQSQRPAAIIWWQLCTKASDNPAMNSSAAAAVRDAILRFSPPGTVIYVSAQNGYIAPHVCSVTGPTGPSRMQSLADDLVAKGLALAGPSVGNLASVEQTPSRPAADQTLADGCHPNAAGETNVLGPRLVRFFG
jgi:hypothetical protein